MFDFDNSEQLPIERCIENLLELVVDNREALLENAPNLEIDIFRGISISMDDISKGICLESGLMRRLADFSIDLLIDVIPNSDT